MADPKLVVSLRLDPDANGNVVPQYVPGAIARGPIVPPEEAREAALELERQNLFAVDRQLKALADDLRGVLDERPPSLPRVLEGRLHNADGTPARKLEVTIEAPEGVEASTWTPPRAVTDARGHFALSLPRVAIPDAPLVLHVANRVHSEDVTLRRADVLAGNAGIIVLESRFEPEAGLLDRLDASLPSLPEDVDANPEDFAELPSPITLGEGDCAASFRSNAGAIDRFRYNALIRLVAPHVGPAPVPQLALGRRSVKMPFSWMLNHPALGTTAVANAHTDAPFVFSQRSAIEEPIDVSGFHAQASYDPQSLPKAASLGLGYVLGYRQTWLPAGHSLGNLVYSLALAPGEEQRVAVFEHDETLEVSEREALTASDRRTYDESADTSTNAVFESALTQHAYGTSTLTSYSRSWGVGGGGAIGGFVGVLFGVGAAGGYGNSFSSGTSSTSQTATRDFASRLAQDFHSGLSRTATARREVASSSVRLAQSSDRQSIATRRLSNQNHCHALTFQYWEVLRHYKVVSEIDDVQLVCFVPLELIPFAQDTTPEYCLELAETVTRQQLLARYRMILRYWDVLWRRLRRRTGFRRGLQALKEFAADPGMRVQSPSDSGDTLNVSITGRFIPAIEDVDVTVVTRNGGRLGPYAVEPATVQAPFGTFAFTSLEALFGALQTQRRALTGVQLTASIPVPSHIDRDDIVRFDVRRRFRRISGELRLPGVPDAVLEHILESWLPRIRVNISPNDLEARVGGPDVWAIRIAVSGSSEAYVDAFPTRNERVTLPRSLPLTARRLPPVLRYATLLEIEKLYQHVVQNTVTYSREVWSSLTPEERAMLLEPYTIGVPEGGVDDIEQQIPLLNCVANRVLGFYGNSMIMPFHIPPALAEARGMTSRDIQDALIAFHRSAFVAPQTSITLPTRGVLAEAVLGSCNACEKIDLTRFWNYSDSPITDAPLPLPAGSIQGQNLVGPAGAAAPAQLAPLGQGTIIGNIVSAAPTEDPAVAAGLLAKDAATATGAPADITGLSTSATVGQAALASATAARSKAVTSGTALAEAVIDTLPQAMRAKAGLPPKPPSPEAKKEEEKKAEDKATAEAAKTAAALKGVVDQAPQLAALIGRSGDADQANAIAKDLLAKQGLAKPDLVQLAALAKAFAPSPSDDAATKLGKNAILSALSITPPPPTDAEKHNAGVQRIIANAATLAAFVGRSNDATLAEVEAKTVIDGIQGFVRTSLTIDQRVLLFDALKDGEKDTPEVKVGKAALRKDLGIQ